VHLTGKKWSDKIYRWHTGYPGGLKERPACEMLKRKPELLLQKAILGMLYRNNLRQSYMEKRLRIYAGPDHPHEAQLPKGVEMLPKVPRKRSGEFISSDNRILSPDRSELLFLNHDHELPRPCPPTNMALGGCNLPNSWATRRHRGPHFEGKAQTHISPEWGLW
jgi:hypothetical protein